MIKSLDSKLQKIRNQKFQPKDFIIADAKDADMGGGIPAPGPKRIKNNFESMPVSYTHLTLPTIE